MINHFIYVVIPAYNCSKFLKSTVCCAIGQGWPCEVILVDDGSKDNTPEICDALAAQYDQVRVFHKLNGGVSSARNTALNYIADHMHEKANPYILFLDADDMQSSGFYDEEVKDILSGDYDLIGFQSNTCNADLSRRSPPSMLKEGVYRKNQVSAALYNRHHFAAMFYSAHLICDNGLRFMEGLKFSEDRLFMQQCFFFADSLFLKNKVLYYYRMNASSAVHNRQFGIPHYEPVFDACQRIDLEMERASGRECTIGKGYISWYIVDMIEEHLRTFQKMDQLHCWLREHELYVGYARTHGGERAASCLHSVERNDSQYRRHQYTIGLVLWIGHIIGRFSVISKLIEKKRYPLLLVEE